MDEMKAVDLGQVMSSIRGSGRPNTVLWQTPDSIAFVARGHNELQQLLDGAERYLASNEFELVRAEREVVAVE